MTWLSGEQGRNGCGVGLPINPGCVGIIPVAILHVVPLNSSIIITTAPRDSKRSIGHRGWKSIYRGSWRYQINAEFGNIGGILSNVVYRNDLPVHRGDCLAKRVLVAS